MERWRWEGPVTVPWGRTFAPLQVNHKRDVSWGSGGDSGCRGGGFLPGRGHSECEGSEPCGSLAPTYSPGGWGLCEVTGMGHKSPWGWGPGVFDCWPVWQGPSQS